MTKSLEAFQKGLQRAQEDEDPEQEAEVLRQLGITYSASGDRVHAIDIYLYNIPPQFSIIFKFSFIFVITLKRLISPAKSAITYSRRIFLAA